MTQFLYIISCKNLDGLYKIGVANDVESRLAQLQTGNPYELEIESCYEFYNAEIAERAIHQAFTEERVRGEWFKLTGWDYDKLRQLCTMLGGAFYMLTEGEINASPEAVEEAEEIQESAPAEGAKWDFPAMFADGWCMDYGHSRGHKDYWQWHKRRNGEKGYIYGGRLADLPYSIENMRRVYRDGLEPVTERTVDHE